MIKIHTIVKDIVMGEMEAYTALVNDYMNMSAYAGQILPTVAKLTKKPVTINSLVVSLSRLREEFKKEKPLMQNVAITNITTKLPLSEIIYENTQTAVAKLELLHKKVSITREDFFTTTIGTKELNIICSSNLEQKILDYFGIKPRLKINNLAAIGISFDEKYFNIPNILFSLIAIIARARVNIAEIVSTYTEIIFIVNEKDFAKTVSLFSELHKKQL